MSETFQSNISEHALRLMQRKPQQEEINSSEPVNVSDAEHFIHMLKGASSSTPQHNHQDSSSNNSYAAQNKDDNSSSAFQDRDGDIATIAKVVGAENTQRSLRGLTIAAAYNMCASISEREDDGEQKASATAKGMKKIASTESKANRGETGAWLKKNLNRASHASSQEAQASSRNLKLSDTMQESTLKNYSALKEKILPAVQGRNSFSNASTSNASASPIGSVSATGFSASDSTVLSAPDSQAFLDELINENVEHVYAMREAMEAEKKSQVRLSLQSHALEDVDLVLSRAKPNSNLSVQFITGAKDSFEWLTSRKETLKARLQTRLNETVELSVESSDHSSDVDNEKNGARPSRRG